MDTELSVPDTMPVASPQVPVLTPSFPNRATVWACKQTTKIASKGELTKGDIRGIFNDYFVYPSRRSNFNELVLIVFAEIDWDFVFNYYRSETCKKSQQSPD